MSHLLPFLLCLTGFAALAFATRRQQRDIFGRPLRRTTTYVLRAVGACVLLYALGLLIAGRGWGLGLVIFSGHTSIAAGIALCVLIGYSRMSARKS